MLVEKKHELGSLQQRIDQLEADNAKLKQPHDSLEKASIQHDMAHLQVLQRQVDSLQKKNQELMLEVARAREQSQDQQEVVQLRMQKEKLQQEVQYLSVQLQKKNTDPREVRGAWLKEWLVAVARAGYEIKKVSHLANVSLRTVGDVSD